MDVISLRTAQTTVIQVPHFPPIEGPRITVTQRDVNIFFSRRTSSSSSGSSSISLSGFSNGSPPQNDNFLEDQLSPPAPIAVVSLALNDDVIETLAPRNTFADNLDHASILNYCNC